MSEPPPIALVTGGSRGIGRAIALRLAADGFRVVVNYRRDDQACADTCAAIRAQGHLEPVAHRADVSDPAACSAMFKALRGAGLVPSVLVNNAGVVSLELFLASRDEEWWSVVRTNLGAVINCCREALEPMIARGKGAIINITSRTAELGAPGQTAYGASKAAITGFTRSLAKEVGALGVSINCVSPGLVETELLQGLGPKVVERALKSVAIGRAGKPEEIAEIVSLLAGGRAPYLLGQVIAVDGGI
jgi:3-oxoacyl-[acyl-carrier protein] reductase